MAELNPEVLERVREELARRPEISSGVLFQMAQLMDSAIGRQSPQWFHTRYVVPVKHEQARSKRKKTRARASRKGKADRARPTPAQPRAVPPAPPPEPPSTPAADGFVVPSEEALPPHPRAAPETRPGQPRKQPARRQRTADERERVRSLLLQLADELARAESRTELVEIVRHIDRYVDRILDRSR